jgi:2-dehydropantoate 2-reductase
LAGGEGRRERVLAAAGIDWATEADRQAVQLDRMRTSPVPGTVEACSSTWQSAYRGAGVEVDYLNGEIALEGRAHGVPTPINVLLQRDVHQMSRQGPQPGSALADDLHARFQEAVRTAA